MKTGIIYIAFGEKCDRLAAHCVGYSRGFSKLPITVFTNIVTHKRDSRWNSVPNVDFLFFDLPVEQNRQIKTTMNKYAPYDFNIYMDADSIIQDNSFDSTIEKLAASGHDLLFNHFAEYPYADGKFQNIYLRALNQFGCTMPLQIYNGAFIGFAVNERTDHFFSTWNRFWREFGAEREMPPLACAINKGEMLLVARLPDGFFVPDHRDDKSVVQHNYNQDFHSRVGVEYIGLHQTKYGVNDYGFTNIKEQQ